MNGTDFRMVAARYGCRIPSREPLPRALTLPA
jgi:hypothetical protein